MQCANESEVSLTAPQFVDDKSRDFQKEFEERYITSTEVAEFVGVSRPAVLYNREKGYLPNHISMAQGKVVLWDRQFIMPLLIQWKSLVERRNGNITA